MPDDVTFESPTTGKVQVVPPEHWNEALKMGYKPHSHKVMYSPQGKRGMVANENLREYMKKGYNTTLEVKAPPLPPTALDKAMALKVGRPPGGGEEAMLAEGAPPAATALSTIGTAGALKTNPMAALKGLAGAVGGGAVGAGVGKHYFGEPGEIIGGLAGSAIGGYGLGSGKLSKIPTSRAELFELITGKAATPEPEVFDVSKSPGPYRGPSSVPKVEPEPMVSEVSKGPGKYRGPEQVRRLQEQAKTAVEKARIASEKADTAARKAVPVSESPSAYRGPESVERVGKVSEGPGPYTGPSSVPKPKPESVSPKTPVDPFAGMTPTSKPVGSAQLPPAGQPTPFPRVMTKAELAAAQAPPPQVRTSPFSGMTPTSKSIGSAELPAARGAQTPMPMVQKLPKARAAATPVEEAARVESPYDIHGREGSILSQGRELYKLGEEPDLNNPVHKKILNRLQTRSGPELRTMANNGDRFAAFILRNMPRP
jgi:hypothetical protein